MRKIIVWFLADFFLLTSCLLSQSPTTLNSSEIFLRLKKLNVLGTVLYVAAHPDDENSRLIAYLAKEKLYRTAYLSMTRGDGGQNLIGNEQGIELGLIRTQEMLAARRIDGAEQFFTRAFDFGFTKSTEEALKMWDKQKILSDVVWVIRKFQPDVVITRFPEEFKRAFHGHHSASAVLAHEACIAAADPTKFPEQFKYGVKPWLVKRLLWNTFNFGNFNTTNDDQFKLDVGSFNSVLGKGYGEIAAESRTQHKSQGAALPKVRGQMIEFFTPLMGDKPENELLDGVNTSWARVEGGSKIESLVNKAIQDYSITNPAASVPALVEIYQEIQHLQDGHWKTQKMKEVQDLIEACSGLWLESTVQNPYFAQGDSIRVNLVMLSRLSSSIRVEKVKMDSLASPYDQVLEKNKVYSFNLNSFVSPAKPISQPYWLREHMSEGSFNVSNQLLIGEPQDRPTYEVQWQIQIDGQTFTCTRPVQYKFLDPVRGELYEPLTVLPPVTAWFDPETIVFTSNKQKEFNVHTKNQSTRNIQPKIELTSSQDINFKIEGNRHNSTYTYTGVPLRKPPATFFSSIVADEQGKTDSLKQLITISYDHIPRIDYFKDAAAKFVVADVQTAGKRIGYIEGAGDRVPEALQQLGYEVVILKERDITPGNLGQFDAIITGVRAYDVHEWLFGKHEILMDYIREGGNLIVQYNRNNLGEKLKIGPYPFTIANIRVTDEHAKVSFVQPTHPVLNYPNKITEADFEGWVQERGIYFAGTLDSNYQAILSMHDPGEQDQLGGLIVGSYGKGNFAYTGLVFFRELPAGVPGSYRLMANLIALNHKRGF
ncbi:MAG: PIG-L family deacetylase [Bacteroidetes bacterium]|nr:MAG: PIG-L family deacetylase [Bacteroidota bacterium]